jgi:exoribonuclease R
LRRVGDRFANEALLSITAGAPLPGWVDEALPQLPKLLNRARRRESNLDRAIVDFAEALILKPLIGQMFTATVTGQRRNGDAIIPAEAEPGTKIRVRLVDANPTKRSIRFEIQD